jgi:hypothetical protein
MMYTEWGVTYDVCRSVTYTSFCIHHMSLTPHSVYIICHLHLILYTSYVTYTSFCIHHMSHLILYTSYLTTYDVYRMRCKWHMMYTEWGVTYDVCRMRCRWHMMYTEWGCHLHLILYTSYVTYTSFCIHHMSHLILYTSYLTYTSFCIHHMSLTPHSVHIICHTSFWMRCRWHMMYTEWGVSDIWCIQNEV